MDAEYLYNYILYMILAVDNINEHGLSNEAHLNTVREEQGNAVLAIHFTVKPFNQLYITNKMEHFSFNSERTMWMRSL